MSIKDTSVSTYFDLMGQIEAYRSKQMLRLLYGSK